MLILEIVAGIILAMMVVALIRGALTSPSLPSEKADPRFLIVLYVIIMLVTAAHNSDPRPLILAFFPMIFFRPIRKGIAWLPLYVWRWYRQTGCKGKRQRLSC